MTSNIWHPSFGSLHFRHSRQNTRAMIIVSAGPVPFVLRYRSTSTRSEVSKHVPSGCSSILRHESMCFDTSARTEVLRYLSTNGSASIPRYERKCAEVSKHGRNDDQGRYVGMTERYGTIFTGDTGNLLPVPKAGGILLVPRTPAISFLGYPWRTHMLDTVLLRW